MCVNVTGLDPSEFVENAEKLIDVILEDREDRERSYRASRDRSSRDNRYGMSQICNREST